MHYRWRQTAAKKRNVATLNSAHQARFSQKDSPKMFYWVLNTLLYFILQKASDVYLLEVLAICLPKFAKHIPP